MNRDPIAFFSYARVNDEQDDGNLTEFRRKLEGEVQVQTGNRFPIFQDRNDIHWGNHWETRINQSIDRVTFLIPIITPSFFLSKACRDEFTAFEQRERTLGNNNLILPVYYVVCDQLEELNNTDSIAKTIKQRHWVDWRSFRFRSFKNEEVNLALASLAQDIKKTLDNAIKEQAAEKAALRIKPKSKIKKTKPSTKALALTSLRVPSYQEDKIDPTDSKYFAFTKKYDEIINANYLIVHQDFLPQLTTKIDALSQRFKADIEKWIADYSETLKNTFITILLDNSGSLRDPHIMPAISASAAIVAETLERASISHEILGHTTVAWRGGKSRDAWLKSGKKPLRPGRLNDLRHIIYKSDNETLRSTLANFSILLNENIYKENIDGEALIWAYERLLQKRQRNKILVVFSDGAPVDDSTMTYNPENILHEHLKSVIQYIQGEQNITLCSVDLNVKRSASHPSYYEKHETINDADKLCVSVLSSIAKSL